MIKLILPFVILCSYAYQYTPAARQMAAATTKTNENESTKVIKSITGFLNWYNAQLHKANSFPFLAKDGNGFYVIDKKACSNYLAFLRSSKYISQNYIDAWQVFFDDKATLLKEQKMKDDIPEDFDMDFILMTQEPEVVLNNISKLKFKVVTMNSKTALIDVKLPADSTVDYKFEMINGKGGWQIEYISTANYD